MLMKVALRSLLTRKLALSLVVLAIALSLSALLITRTLSDGLRSGFSSSVSGTDLIVAARSHPLQVVLYSVFRLGSPTQALSAQRWDSIRTRADVAWSFPLVLGDSHRGYAVIGTTDEYFVHFRYGRQQSLQSEAGAELAFRHPLQVIIGAEVARTLGYERGDHLIISHGSHQHSFHHHDELSFAIAAVLQPTGTPVDRSIHVHLNTLEALHSPELLNLVAGAEPTHVEHSDTEHEHEHEHDHKHDHDHDHQHGHHPLHIPAAEAPALPALSFDQLPSATAVSAVFVGLKSRALAFRAQAQLNAADAEPLTAVMPGVALSEFWQLMAQAESLLQLLSAVMLVTALLGSVAMLQLSLVVRQPEIGLLRLIGARPRHILALLQLEVLLMMAASWLLALLLGSAFMALLQHWLGAHYGVAVSGLLSLTELPLYMLLSVVLALVAGLIPALSAYRMSLHPANL